jgi:putative BNR repeat neuraminidase/PKD domain-containing protein
VRLHRFLPLACTVALLCALIGVSHATARPHRIVSFGGGAWSWFADPRAVYHLGQRRQTYLGWVDRRGRVNVASYDRSGQRTRTVLKNFQQADDHDNPALLVLPSGRIAAFFSHHSSGFLGYRVSDRVEDVSSFGPRVRIATNSPGRLGFTYPNPVLLRSEGGVIYLFWRGGNWNPTFSRKFPSGRWRQARTLIRGVPGQRPYMKVASNSRTIAFAYTNGHPRETATSVYFVKYRDGYLRGPGGRRIRSLRRVPITPRQGSLVHSFHRTRLRTWVHDVALTQSGRPVIVYAAFDKGRRHRYYYAVWNGRRWARHLMVSAGGPITSVPRERFYSGGITLDHENPRTVYLSRQVGRYHQIERWHTPDGGNHWSRKRLTRSRTGNFRPISPRGLRGRDDVIWMHGRYGRYERFYTSIFAQLKMRSSPPKASFRIASSGRELRFHAAGSHGVSAAIAHERWQFGDGTEAAGRRTSHRYARPGTYFPRLTVTDAAGLRDTLVVEVRVR